MYETLIVDSTDISVIAACVTSLDGLYQVGQVRGDNITFPGVDGETWIDRPFEPGTIELGIILKGDTTTQFNDAYRVLKKLVPPGKPVTLRRRTSYSTGNEEHVASGEYAGGLAPTISLARFGRVTLSMKVHEGVWYETFTRTLSIMPGASFVVEGETRTQRMVVTMPANSNIYNLTNGHSLTNTRTSGGLVTVDVEAMTAVQDGADVSDSLLWNMRFPFRLEAGLNEVTGSSGVYIDYTAAYL